MIDMHKDTLEFPKPILSDEYLKTIDIDGSLIYIGILQIRKCFYKDF